MASPVTVLYDTSSTDYRSSVLSAPRENVRFLEDCAHHSFLVYRWIVGRKIKILVNLYETIAQHGCSRVQKGNTLELVSLACNTTGV